MDHLPVFEIRSEGKIIAPARRVPAAAFYEFCNMLKRKDRDNPIRDDRGSERTLPAEAHDAPFRVTYRRGYHFHLVQSEDYRARDKAGHWVHHFTNGYIYMKKPETKAVPETDKLL